MSHYVHTCTTRSISHHDVFHWMSSLINVSSTRRRWQPGHDLRFQGPENKVSTCQFVIDKWNSETKDSFRRFIFISRYFGFCRDLWHYRSPAVCPRKSLLPSCKGSCTSEHEYIASETWVHCQWAWVHCQWDKISIYKHCTDPLLQQLKSTEACCVRPRM